ncbi:fatty acid hydroxylase family protein [Leptospira ognonensis]|uniref:Fatty acid hydroxylase family protein n=1 Tax=Leptospira ognonensis TaxID=2484945 RepID=A0A4R9K4V3_9LEPT|nr:sterol desaturase family protein [Leptospira ognonensis]TGL60204.1 fatty acid hydroxylase family protein [Leptospira ognonensis]
MDLKIEHFPFSSLLSSFLDVLALPILNILKTTGRLSWLYLLSALVLGFLTILLSLWKNKQLTMSNVLRESFDFAHWKHPSSITDYVYYFVETILYTSFLSYFVITSLSVSILTFSTLQSLVGTFNLGSTVWIQIIYTFIFLCAYDFSRFYIHRLEHKYKVLWEFHKFHHSAKTLNPFTVYRIHPIESLLLNTLSGISTGIVTGVFVLFFPGITMYTLAGVNFGLFLFHLYSNLRHTHVWLNFPKTLSYILLSPAQHQIHHSIGPKHLDKNLGAIFGFWDYFYGTLYIPTAKEELIFGLAEDENGKDFTNLFRIFYMPFLKVMRKLKNRT